MDGDEWKGEQEGWSFSWPSFVFKPLSEEEKAAMKVEDDKNALRHSLLPPFRPDRGCVKCGHDKTRTRRAGHAYGSNREALARSCRRCGYQWYERCLSEEES